jgi:hypothetical protein
VAAPSFIPFPLIVTRGTKSTVPTDVTEIEIDFIADIPTGILKLELNVEAPKALSA